MALPKGMVWITGASSGIGWATALLMAREGWDVAASARNEKALTELSKRYNTIKPYPLDVTDPIQREEVYGKIRSDMGPVDVLVNNAGYAIRGAMEEVPVHEIRDLFDVNVFAPLALSRLVLPEMRDRRAGRIIFVGSVVGRVSFPINGSYSSSKHALAAMADAMRMELQPWDVKIVQVEPGPIKTRFGSNAKEKTGKRILDTSSPYAPYNEKYLKGMFKPEAYWPASTVARTILTAARARSPKGIYPVHPLAQFLPLLRSILPLHIVDWALSKDLGLNEPAGLP